MQCSGVWAKRRYGRRGGGNIRQLIQRDWEERISGHQTDYFHFISKHFRLIGTMGKENDTACVFIPEDESTSADLNSDEKTKWKSFLKIVCLILCLLLILTLAIIIYIIGMIKIVFFGVGDMPVTTRKVSKSAKEKSTSWKCFIRLKRSRVQRIFFKLK